MKESKSARESLQDLEMENKYVFHGSGTGDIEIFEPRQSYVFINGKDEKDDEPAVHASEFSNIAILMALVNKENCKEGFRCGFKYENKVILSVTQKSLSQLNESSEGYVYVFSKDNFKARYVSELVSYVPVKPVMVVKVRVEDLSTDLEITN